MQETNITVYEIDGKNYIIAKKIEYKNNTYVLLVNERNYLDSFVQKEVGETLEPVEDLELVHKVLYLMKNE